MGAEDAKGTWKLIRGALAHPTADAAGAQRQTSEDFDPVKAAVRRRQRELKERAELGVDIESREFKQGCIEQPLRAAPTVHSRLPMLHRTIRPLRPNAPKLFGKRKARGKPPNPLSVGLPDAWRREEASVQILARLYIFHQLPFVARVGLD